MREDEIVGWHHRLNGYEFEQAPGVGDGQGGLACCGPWGSKELEMTELLNNNNKNTLSNSRSQRFHSRSFGVFALLLRFLTHFLKLYF